MIDSVQKTSTVPVPGYQTQQNNQDPAPVTSPDRISKDDDKRLAPSRDSKKDDFESYLEQSSISHLQENSKSSRHDTVADIKRNSVYGDPGQSTPI